MIKKKYSILFIFLPLICFSFEKINESTSGKIFSKLEENGIFFTKLDSNQLPKSSFWDLEQDKQDINDSKCKKISDKLAENKNVIKNNNQTKKNINLENKKNNKNSKEKIKKSAKRESCNPKINSIFIFEDSLPKKIPIKKGILIDACISNKIKSALYYELKKCINNETLSETSNEIKQKIIDTFISLSMPFVIVNECYQNCKDGIYIYSIEISRLCDIKILCSKYFKSTLLRKYFSLKKTDIIDLDEIALSLHLVNRNPFRLSNAIFTPGNCPLTTNLTINTKDRLPIRLYAGAENLGFEEIEKERFYVGTNITNLFYLDHTFYYQFTASIEPKRFWANTFDYTAPINWKQFLHIFGGFSKVKGDMTQSFLTKGKSSQVSLRYEKPLFASKEWIHEMSLGFDYKRTNTNLEQGGSIVVKNAVNITQFLASYKITKNWDYYRLFSDLQLFYSPGRLIKDQKNSDFSALRPFAKNSYFYFRSHIDAIFFLPKNFAIQNVITAQGSTNNLLPSEQIGLGGLFSVRGYNERVVNVDNALINDLEFRSPKYQTCFRTKNLGDLQAIYFIDLGIGSNCKKIPTERNLYFLIGTGPGIRYNYKENVTFQLDLGFPLNHLLDNKHPHVHFRVNVSY